MGSSSSARNRTTDGPHMTDAQNVAEPAVAIEVYKTVNGGLNNNTYENVYKMINNYTDFELFVAYIDGNNIDVRKDNNAIFLYACVNGYLELANFMYDRYYANGQYDIHSRNDVLLRYMIRHAREDIVDVVVNWFIQLDDYNVRSANDRYFFELCKWNRLSLARELEEMIPTYRIETGPKDGYVKSDGEREDEILDENLDIIDMHIIPDGKIDAVTFVKSLHIIFVPSRTVYNVECPSCMEKDNLILLPCDHCICATCFRDWYYNSRKYSLCMICTKKFRYSDCVFPRNVIITKKITDCLIKK